jgi:hypothetical protein
LSINKIIIKMARLAETMRQIADGYKANVNVSKYLDEIRMAAEKGKSEVYFKNIIPEIDMIKLRSEGFIVEPYDSKLESWTKVLW